MTAESTTHPLQNSWCFWIETQSNKRQTNNSWGANLKNMTTITTVESFWGLFNHILEPTQLNPVTNYYFFKQGIEPKWEDPHNAKGGKWQLVVPKLKRQHADEFWINSLLMLIGEALDEDASEDVAGVVLSVRKGQDRIAIWVKNAEDLDLQRKIGTKWRQLITPNGLQAGWSLEFYVHDVQKAAIVLS